ncbi:MAG: hypothetical protein GTO18_13085 [Anaerolineales bacterium]|nr:hypothetical protein [Anaerolineales bacterium]
MPTSVIDEKLLPEPRRISYEERRAFKNLAYYEAWAWFQAATYWIPGRIGWIIRRLLYKPFFQRAGKGWHIAEYCSVQPPNRFQIGDKSVVSRYTIINAQGGVILKDGSGFGPFTQVISVNHTARNTKEPWGLQTRILEAAPIIVESNVWIGARCIILAGVRIGPNAVVAAGSVVTRDVKPFTMVGGVPAQVIRRLDDIPEGDYVIDSILKEK